jgi:hypothetical protein
MHDLDLERFGGGLDRGQQVQVILQPRQRRHEDVQHRRLLALGLRLRAVGAARVAASTHSAVRVKPWADSKRVGGCMKPCGSGWPGLRPAVLPAQGMVHAGPARWRRR